MIDRSEVAPKRERKTMLVLGIAAVVIAIAMGIVYAVGDGLSP